MRRVDDFKIVAVNGTHDPGMRDLLLEATREVIAAMSDWQPIETAPKPEEYAPILVTGPDRDGNMAIGLAYWYAQIEWVEVPVGDNLYRRERVVRGGYWRSVDDAKHRFEPTKWMPAPPYHPWRP